MGILEAHSKDRYLEVVEAHSEEEAVFRAEPALHALCLKQLPTIGGKSNMGEGKHGTGFDV